MLGGIISAITIAVGAAAIQHFSAQKGASDSLMMFVAVSIAAWFVSLLDGSELESNPTIGIGISAWLLSIPTAGNGVEIQLCMAAGAGLIAIATRSITATSFAVAMSSLVAVNGICSFVEIDHAIPHLGTTIGLLAAIASLVSLVPKLKGALAGLVSMALIGSAAAFVIHTADDAFHLYICIVVASITAFVTGIVIGEEDDLTRRTLMSIAWVAVLTVSFTLSQTAGLAIAVLIGALYAISIRSTAMVACLAPAIGIAIIRMFRLMYHDAGRSFDLGKHYAVIGLCVGIAIPHLVTNAKFKVGSAGSHLFALLCGTVPAIVLILTGAKGAYGLIVGLSVSALLPATKESRSIAPIAGMTVGLIGLLQYSWLEHWFTETRNDRLKGAAWPVGFAILLLAAWLFDNRKVAEAKS